MNMIINPGSKTIGGSIENARKEAQRLLECMLDEGMTDIELVDEKKEGDGTFTFTYQHKITKKTGEWNITGLEWNNLWKKEGHTFPPRMYWNGSSCSNPEWKDFLTDDYELTVRKIDRPKLKPIGRNN